MTPAADHVSNSPVTSHDGVASGGRGASQRRVGTGIALEPLRAVRVEQYSDSQGWPPLQPPDEAFHSTIPPSVLLPRLTREPLRLQTAQPRHPRGSNDIWPPEAVLNSDRDHGEGPLIPLALAWLALSCEPLPAWSWTTPEDEVQRISPAEVIAASVAALLLPESDVTPVLTIPNDLKMSRQQVLIDECSQLGVRVKLLWRPVAAALMWCELHSSAILELHSGREGSIGTLLSVHLGLDQFEITPLELVIQQVNEKRCLLPARRRPKGSALPSCGIDWLMNSLPGVPNEIWQRLWTTDAAHQWLRAPGESLESFLDRPHPRNWQADCVAGEWLPPVLTQSLLDNWLRNCRDERTETALQGVIVTGELATTQFSHSVPLWRHVLTTQGVAPDCFRLLLDQNLSASTGSATLTGRGASRHALTLLNDEPSYLDTLPRLKTVTYVAGQPDWIDLLKHDDGWVEGGKIWRRPAPLSGLCIQEDRSELEVVVSHDEFDTVRKLRRTFRQAIDRDIPVQLEVEVEPAQGNARLEVVPTETAATIRPMKLEWSRMEDTQLSREEFITTLPTLFPPLLRRAGSLNQWNSARVAMQAYCRSRFRGTLNSVVTCLQQRGILEDNSGNFEARTTAVSSDGMPGGPDPEVLNEFVEIALERLDEISSGKEFEELIRALGYSSTPHEKVQAFLASRLKSQIYLGQHELTACGWCLREPTCIAAFGERLARLLRSSPTAINNWLKAFAEMLRYRDDATRDMSSQLCEELTERIVEVLKVEHGRRNYQMIFRNSCLCIVYLLRRRAFDDDYLAIGSSLQNAIRQTFTAARDGLKRSRGIGGSINLANVLQTMIDYVDRKGPPLLATSSGLQELTTSGADS